MSATRDGEPRRLVLLWRELTALPFPELPYDDAVDTEFRLLDDEVAGLVSHVIDYDGRPVEPPEWRPELTRRLLAADADLHGLLGVLDGEARRRVELQIELLKELADVVSQDTNDS